MNKNNRMRHLTFESLKQEEGDCEFWSGRELSQALDYTEYDSFLSVVEKAKKACTYNGYSILDHFEDVAMVKIRKSGQRKVEDIRLSRYACYLIVQNGDSSKPIIAYGQTYLASQARKQELTENLSFQQLSEDEKQQYLRIELREHNKILNETAQQVGAIVAFDFEVFHNHGYRGLLDKELGGSGLHQN